MKIYVHHYYTYELFWYFFHATNPINTIPTWFGKNRFNKEESISDNIEIKTEYKGNVINCIFCNDNYWYANDGYHVWDYTIHQYERKKISDRGWNLIMGKDLENEIIPKLNKYSKKLKNKLSVFFIDWEFGDNQIIPNLNKKLSKDITLFKDELTDIINNQKVSFTHILWSFIFPNTIKLREYHYFSDYLKYKKDYKYKINYPIRRITYLKNKIANLILTLNNKQFNITVSSFTNYFKDNVRHSDIKYKYFSSLQKKIGKQNVIQKRGYGIHDWGGEWNDDNMKEFMWKLMTISEVNLVHEESYGWSINEKSFMHILAEKPFIPTHDGTFSFYDEILKSYGFGVSEFPIKGHPWEKVVELDSLTRDDEKWDEFVDKIKNYISKLKKNLFEIMNTNNGYLDSLLDKESETKSIL